MSSSTAGSSIIYQDRENVFESAGQGVPLVDIDSFCQHLLPKVPELPEIAIQNIVDEVTRGPAYVNRRWTAFAQDPMHDGLREDESFKALVPVVSAIRTAVTVIMPGREPTTEFVTAPEDPPISTVLPNDVRPDAYFVVKDPCRSSKTASWLDIAITGEFNKGDTDYADDTDPNTKQALWNMHHTNREDARRQCLFAFTIENRTMRLWYADRSVIIVSDGFDFMVEPGPLIRFVLAFSYAPLHNMGFDPTMALIWDGDPLTKPQYIINVQSRTEPGTVKTYKTVNVLSASGAEAMRGGGTRVWTVREWADGKMHGEELALKDCWIGLNGDVEGEIMEQLKKAPKAAKDKKELADMLLTVSNDGVVLLDDGSEVRTLHGDPRGRLVENNPRTYRIACLYDPGLSIGSSDDSSVSDNPGDATESNAPSIIYPAKKRYRIVFTEICQPLHEVQPVEARVCTLARACWDLKLLHKLGWVHRNLNSGSILLLGETVKFADLKYAKKMDKKTSSESYENRTDTRDYLSIEAASQKFAFLPSKEFDLRPTELAKRVLKRKLIAPTNEGSFIEPHIRSDIAPWFYSPLHDMESIEWIIIDIFANRNPIFEYRKNSRGLKYKEEVVQQWERVVKASNVSRQIFVESNGNKHSLITDNFALKSTLSSILHPVLVSMAEKIASMRDCLVEYYRKAEEDPRKIDHKCANGVHDNFTIILMEIADHIGAIGCDMRDEPLSEAVKTMPQRYSDMTYGLSKKRSRDVDDVDDATNDDHGDYPYSKLARTSVGKSPHGSPRPLPVLRSHILHNSAIADRPTRRRNITTALTSTRTLRSQVKKR